MLRLSCWLFSYVPEVYDTILDELHPMCLVTMCLETVGTLSILKLWAEA